MIFWNYRNTDTGTTEKLQRPLAVYTQIGDTR